MVPSLRVPSTHRERETSLPRSCTTLTPSDDERDATDQPSHERSSEDVTATPSRDERSTHITAKHFAEDISDTLRPSPWSKKILLALDGGGVRGYSSLLILEELLGIIARLETGKEESNERASPEERLRFWPPHSSSRECPWHVGRDEEKDEEKFLIHHYFDYVAGTSTGGLSAIMLSRMKMGILKAKNQYDVVGNSVFGKPRRGYRDEHYAKIAGGLRRAKYRTGQIETALQTVIRNGAKSESERTHVYPTNIVLSNENKFACQTAVVADTVGGPVEGPYTFRSYDHPRPARRNGQRKRYNFGDFGPAHQVKLWEVARATSAAPFYFEKMVIGGETFQDGGLGTNNPAYRVAAEIGQIHGGRFPAIILSIGTGQETEKDKVEPSDEPLKYRQHHFQHLRDIFNLMGRMGSIVTESENTHKHLQTRVNDLSKADGSTHPVYFRFNAPGIDHIALDNWDPPTDGKKTLEALQEKTEDYLKQPEVKERLRQCAIELVRLRRQRMLTERWEQFATNVVYSCPIPEADCRKETTLGFPGRDKLRRHLFECHEYVTWATVNGDWYCTIGECVHWPTLLQGGLEGERREELRNHLQRVHRFENPTCMTVPQFEEWLNAGKTTTAGLERQESERIEKQTDVAQQQGTGPVQRDNQIRHQRNEGGASASALRDVEDGNATTVSRGRWRLPWPWRHRHKETELTTPAAKPVLGGEIV